MLSAPATASSVLALVTTIHLGLAALRNHRRITTGPLGSLAIVSLLLAGLPWVFASPVGLIFGLALHAAWFAACELGVRPPAPAAAHPPAQASRVPSRPAPPMVSAPRAEPERHPGFVPVPVLAVLDETPTIKTIRLARPSSFEFQAGQFVTVRMRVDGRELLRCYSISSAPDARGYLEISIRRQGTVSNALHAAVRAGTSLAVKGPTGVFTYPDGDDRPIVLLGAGIGITPLMSMTRHAVAHAPARLVTLLYCARTEDDFAFKDELAVLGRRHSQLRVQLAVSGGPAGPSVYPGHIDESLVRTTVPHVADSVCMICGPSPMIESMRVLLARLNVPPAQVRHEVFNAAIAASAARAPESPAVAPPVRPAPGRPDTKGACYEMVCNPGSHRVPIGACQTILEAAEDAHVPIVSLCRAGVCGTCRVRITSGEVSCTADGLDDRDRQDGYVLACSTTARSDCTVQV